MSSARRILAAGVILAALTSCGAPAGDPPEDVAVYPASGDGAGDSALLTGTLVREDGCTYVIDDEGGERWLPVFADSVRADDEGDALEYGRDTYTYDAEVELGGGESGSFESDNVPPDCDTSVPGWHVADPG